MLSGNYKKKIPKINYGIGHDKNKINDFMPLARVRQIRFEKAIISMESIDPESIEALNAAGYTHTEISQLLKLGVTPLVMQKLANPNLKLNAHQSIDVIVSSVNMGKPESEKARGQDMALVLGNTGVGKSTFVNYLNGCEIGDEEVNGRSVAVVKNTSAIKQVTEIGHGKSKTFIPAVIAASHIHLTFADCPGYSDTRGEAIETSNAINMLHTIKNAKSVKIIVLIDYAAAKDPRGVDVAAIVKAIDGLFGYEGAFAKNAASILVGVNNVPQIERKKDITLISLKGLMRPYKHLPDEIIDTLMILDPFGDRDGEGCSREDWLKSIASLSPVKDHAKTFKVSLSGDSKTMLAEVSKEICNGIQESLNQKKYMAAALKLEQMDYLNVIQLESVKDMYQDNINGVIRYIDSVEQGIKNQVINNDWQAAYNQTVEYQRLVGMFFNPIPMLENKLNVLVEFINAKQLEKHTLDAKAAIDAFTKEYDQNIELQKKIAISAQQVLYKSEPSINESSLTDYLPGILKELLVLDKQFLGPLIENLSYQLAILQDVASKQSKSTAVSSVEALLVIALKHVAETSQRVNEEMALAELKTLNISILGQVDRLKKKVSWNTNGKEMLKLFKSLKMDAGLKDLIVFVSTLVVIVDVAPTVKNLKNSLERFQEIMEGLGDKLININIKELPKLDKLVLTNLMQIMDDLVAEQVAEELRLRKEKEKQEVDKIKSDIKEVINNNNFLKIDNIAVRLAKLNLEQLTLLNQDKEISLILIEKLQASFSSMKSKINWEANGSDILDIIDIEIPPLNFEIGSEVIFDKLKAIKDVKPEAEAIQLILCLQRTIKNKLVIDAESVIKIIKVNITYIKNDLKVLREKEEQVEKINHLISIINSELLPSNNFLKLNQSIILLLKIAPEQIKVVPLKAKFDEIRRQFSEQLSAKQYEAANGKSTLLLSFEKELRAILPEFGIKFNVDECHNEILNHLASTTPSAQSEFLDSFLNSELTNDRVDIKSLDKFREYFVAIAKFQDVPGVNQLAKDMIAQCSSRLKNVISQYAINKNSNVYAKVLMQIECVSVAIGSSSADFTTSIRAAVGEMINENTNIDFLGAVGFVLKSKAEDGNRSSQYAQAIMSQHPQFSRAETQRWLSITSDRTADQVLKELNVVNKSELQTTYDIYFKEYESIIANIVNKFQTPEDAVILSSAIDAAKQQGKKLDATTSYGKYPKEIGVLVANIFGVWSYLDAHAGGFKKDRSTLRQPHPSQVLSVLLLFGMDNSKEAAQNHLLQVKTGEGKSVVGAAAAIAFALVGYQVHVACYNPWLAKRDENAFKSLFEVFNLRNDITYGDFNTHVDYQLNQMGDTVGMVRKLLKNQKLEAAAEKNKKSMLLIDEVDVFFGKNFLGESFTPLCMLYSDSYKALLITVWDNRTKYKVMNRAEFESAVSSLPDFVKFKSEYPNAEPLFKYFINEMHDSFQCVVDNQHEYMVYEQAIGYKNKVTNSVSTHTVDSQRTAFAAIKEYQSKTVSLSHLNLVAAPSVIGGSYSYAELPKQYSMITGVTGTLMALDAFQNEILTEYGINRKTVIPSVFKKNPLVGEKNVTICGGAMDADNNGYFAIIKNRIESMITRDRAAIIIFEDEARLEQYQSYITKHEYTTKKMRINVLLIDANPKMRNLMIGEAATSGTLTLMPKEYGRGSDFICRDSQLRKSGGVGILCAYFPDDESEEVQDKGRTCRQEDTGSFEFILYFDDLMKKYNINSMAEIPEGSAAYDYLVQKRRESNDKNSHNFRANLNAASDAHQQTLKMVKIFTDQSFFSISNKKDDAFDILQSMNRFKFNK